MAKEKILIETPVETSLPGVAPAETHSVGSTAVLSSLVYSFKQMGILRSVRTLTKLNHKGGFDCPSCAWPDPDGHRALAEFCENGARAVADEATTQRAGPELFARYSLAELSQQSDMQLGHHGRLTHPMIKRKDATHYQPIEWDDAFTLLAKKLNGLDHPDEASFYTSGRTSNEAAFVYQLFARLYGTNNLPDCSNMCHESSGFAMGQQVGVGKGTVTLEDLHISKCILIIGQNPGTNHPRMLSALQKAVRAGAKIISINPLPEAGMTRFRNPQEIGGMLGFGTPLACLHLPVQINGDVALAKGLMKELLAMEEAGGAGRVFDLPFIREYTHGYEDLLKDVREASWDEIVTQSGCSRDSIHTAAKIIAESPSMILCWAMGLTQHKNGVANIQCYTNIALLRGCIGRPGAGLCPVRGHSNVQGDRTMGIFEKMPDSFMNALGKEFDFQPPVPHGFDTVATIKAMHDGRVKVFFGLGGNFLAATPDTEFVAEGMRRCRLTVHVSTKMNRAHLVCGEEALILPCLGRTERDEQASGVQFVTVEDSMSVVHSSQGTLPPGSEFLRSEVAIVGGLAKAVFKNDPYKLSRVKWDDLIGNYDLIRDHVAHFINGFENFNARVRVPGGFYLPNGPKDSRSFATDSHKAEFKVHPIAKTTLPKGRYRLMTIRSHDQFNTTIYGPNDRYRGITEGRRVVFMNREDMFELLLEKGSLVDLTSHHNEVTREAAQFSVVPYEIPRQCLAVYYPEGNVLVPIDSVAEHSNTPAYKSIEVSLRPHQT